MSSPRLALLTLALALNSASAVITVTGDGSGNTTAPGVDDFGFAKVGLVWDVSDAVYIGGVYLGDGWVLTAYHGVRDVTLTGFQLSTVRFGLTDYTLDQTSGVRLTTPGQGNADLALIHMVGPYPVLDAAMLSMATPATGSTLAMAGIGRNRDTAETHWNVTAVAGPDNDIWTETGGAGDRQGFDYAGGATLRWGMNKRTTNAAVNVNDGFGITKMFRTQFDNDGSAIADEAQAAPGDSGGGVFYKNGLNWELAGIMLLTTDIDGQPVDTAVFTNQTFIADVATYQSQIAATIPEPASLTLALAGLALFGARRRRR